MAPSTIAGIAIGISILTFLSSQLGQFLSSRTKGRSDEIDKLRKRIDDLEKENADRRGELAECKAARSVLQEQNIVILTELAKRGTVPPVSASTVNASVEGNVKLTPQ